MFVLDRARWMAAAEGIVGAAALLAPARPVALFGLTSWLLFRDRRPGPGLVAAEWTAAVRWRVGEVSREDMGEFEPDMLRERGPLRVCCRLDAEATSGGIDEADAGAAGVEDVEADADADAEVDAGADIGADAAAVGGAALGSRAGAWEVDARAGVEVVRGVFVVVFVVVVAAGELLAVVTALRMLLGLPVSREPVEERIESSAGSESVMLGACCSEGVE